MLKKPNLVELKTWGSSVWCRYTQKTHCMDPQGKFPSGHPSLLTLPSHGPLTHTEPGVPQTLDLSGQVVLTLTPCPGPRLQLGLLGLQLPALSNLVLSELVSPYWSSVANDSSAPSQSREAGFTAGRCRAWPEKYTKKSHLHVRHWFYPTSSVSFASFSTRGPTGMTSQCAHSVEGLSSSWLR